MIQAIDYNHLLGGRFIAGTSGKTDIPVLNIVYIMWIILSKLLY